MPLRHATLPSSSLRIMITQTRGALPKPMLGEQRLDLPDNIDELDKETKCKWLKSSFRKMSLRWHPDKTKGGKRRAQRKSSEISEGKSLLEIQFGCKGKQRNRR